MRVLLDAHISSRHVGRRLASAGHDVLPLDQDERLSQLADEDALALAVEEERIVITHNVRHFVLLVRSWAETRKSHHGLILVTLPHNDYGAILHRLEQTFAARPGQAEWVDRVEFVGGSS